MGFMEEYLKNCEYCASQYISGERIMKQKAECWSSPELTSQPGVQEQEPVTG